MHTFRDTPQARKCDHAFQRGAFLWTALHPFATAGAFWNDDAAEFCIFKFDHRKGLRWVAYADNLDSILYAMSRLAGLGRWRISYRASFWRNMPPELALLFKKDAPDSHHFDYYVVDELAAARGRP